MTSINKSTLFLLGFTAIRLAEARSVFGTQSTYLHPIGGTEIEHNIGRKNTVIVAAFEMMYFPEDVFIPTNRRNQENFIMMRALNIFKNLGLPCFFISNEIITTVKIHHYEVTNLGTHPNQPIIRLELRELPMFRKASALLTGILLGSASITGGLL